MQSRNISLILFTFELPKLWISSVTNDIQLLNVYIIVVNFAASKLDKFKYFKFVQ